MRSYDVREKISRSRFINLYAFLLSVMRLSAFQECNFQAGHETTRFWLEPLDGEPEYGANDKIEKVDDLVIGSESLVRVLSLSRMCIADHLILSYRLGLLVYWNELGFEHLGAIPLIRQHTGIL